MKQLLMLLAMVASLVASAQYKRFEFRRVQVAPGITTTAYVALPPGYDSLRATPYPVVFVGKGLHESFASVQSNGVFGLLRKGMIPDTTQWVFIHLDRGSTTFARWIPFALNSMIYRNRLHIDSTNVFVTGHSAGGGYAMAAWFGQNVGNPPLPVDTVLNLAAKVRAVVAQAPNQDFNENNWQIAKQVVVPSWVIVGANDQAAYVERAKRIFNNVEVPGAVTLTIRAGVGHGGWDAVYNGSVKMPDGKTMWQFFTSRLRPVVAPEPVETSRYEVVYFSDGTVRVRKISGADRPEWR